MGRSTRLAVALGTLLAALPGASLALTVDLELETVTVDPATKEIVLAGTVTCDAGATLRIGFAVTQGPATAGDFAVMACTGTEQSWEIREPLGTPRVHAGPATLEFGFTAELGAESIASGRSVEIFVAPAGAPWLFAVAPEEDAP
jgi:hypothetical protein